MSVFHHVANGTDAHSLWTKLEGLYERKTAQNKAFLIRRLVNLKLKGRHVIAEHLSDFKILLISCLLWRLFWMKSCRRYFS